MSKKIKTIEELLKKIKDFKTAKDIVEKLNYDYYQQNNDKSKQGYIYERLWDICIKFGLVKSIISFDNNNNKLLHIIGNINLQQKLVINNFKEFKDFFKDYLKTNIQSGNSGGYSDITFRNEEGDIIISSSKYYDDDEKFIKDYDIQNLCPFFTINPDLNIKTILFINDKEKFIKKRKSENKSSLILTKYINPYGNYENVYDLKDLEFYFIELKKILKYYNNFETTEDLNNFKKGYLLEFKSVFIPKFHQSLYINQIDKIISKQVNRRHEKNILIGAIPRTGKSYIMAGIIKKFLIAHKKTNNNFLIITPAPTETIPQYKEIFNNYLDFNNLNVIDKTEINNSKSSKHSKDNNGNNLYIFSKQTLDYDNNDKENKKEIDKIIKILQDIEFDIIFIDEAHYGMTTDKSENLLNKLLDVNSYRIFITATYNKPLNTFSILDKNKLIWSLENVIDLEQIANYNGDDKIKFTITKFKDFYDKFIKLKGNTFNVNIINDILYNDYNIDIKKFNETEENYDKLRLLLNQYKDFPEPFLITTVWKNVDKIYNEIRLANGLSEYTFNMDTLFDLKNQKFENEDELIELFHYFLGYKRKTLECKNSDNVKIDVDYEFRNEYAKYGILPRINNICQNNCRTLQQPVNKTTTTSQLWFLPTNQDKLSNKIPALLKLLSENFKPFFKKTLFLVAISSNSDIKKQQYENLNNVIYDIKNKDDINAAKNNNITDKNENNYKNIVILTGFKFNLGISLHDVDIVVLFNNSMSSDLIYQMMFRSMTEVIDNEICLPNSYCHKKKYGFIVDLNPQRTLFLINGVKKHLIKNDLNKEENEEEVEYKTCKLLNIDADYYKSNYDNENDNNIKIKDFSLQFFKKLNENAKENSNNIFKQLKAINITINPDFIINVSKYIRNFKFENKKKEEIYKEGLDITFKTKIKQEIEKKYPKIDEKKQEDIFNDYIRILGIISEFLPILSILTEIDAKCIFKYNNQYYKKDLKSNLDKINKNKELQEIFIEFIEDRCKLYFEDKSFKNYYDFFVKLIDNINKTDTKTIRDKTIRDKTIRDKTIRDKTIVNKTIRDKPKLDKTIRDKTIVNKTIRDKKECPPDKILNPKTNKCVLKKGIIGKKLLKKGGASEGIQIMEENIRSIKSEFDKTIKSKNPDKLLEFIDRHLKPTEKKKKENGEVFTPMKLVNEMLDKLEEADSSVFSNPNLKWLDPAAGMGNFPVAVYLRLMKGLALIKGLENEEKRRKWILEEMLYMVEYDKTNVFMMKKILCGDKYKLNIFHGSFIDGKDYSTVYKTNIKFNIIIGNPPYNDRNESPIYNEFIESSINMNPNYLMFIVPSRWFSGGKGLDKFRKMMLNRSDIEFINHFENASELFGKDVDIKGGVNYFLINNSYNGLCKFNGIMIKLNRYDTLVTNPKFYSIIDKLNKFSKKINNIYKGQGNFNIKSNDNRLKDKIINKNYIKCYVSQRKGNYKYIDKGFINKNMNKWKVITSRSYGASKYFGNIFIGKPNEVYSQSYISFEVNNEREAKSLLSYLKCKLPNFMLSLRKNTQEISEKTLIWIPLPPLDRQWNNIQVYNFIKLSKEEIKLIEENI